MDGETMDGDSIDDGVEAALRRLFADAYRDAGAGADDPPPVALDGVMMMPTSEATVDELDRPAVAVRSGAAVADRQLLVRGGWTEVVIDVADAGTAVDVRGTVFGVDDVCAVQLLDGAREVGLTTTDDLGEFALRGIERGRYELIVASGRAELSAMVDVG